VKNAEELDTGDNNDDIGDNISCECRGSKKALALAQAAVDQI